MRGAQFGLIVWKRFVVQAFSGPIESDGVVMALPYVNVDEDIDGVMLLGFLHRSVVQIEPVGLQHRWQVSASTSQKASRCCSGRAPISDHEPPTGPRNNTPRVMTATGGESDAGSGWPNPQLSGRENSNGAGVHPPACGARLSYASACLATDPK
jgi:hypothetical protein